MLLLAALLALCAGAAALAIPVDPRAACAPVMLIHAPGTSQQGLDSVGEPLAAGLAREISGLTSLGLPYNTSAEYLVTPAQGARLLADTLETQAVACPDQRFILSGYSKGAMVVHLASLDLSAEEKTKVCGVSVFGDPYDKDGILGLLGLDDDWPIQDPVVGGNVIEFCNKNDIFCDGGLDVDAHRAYPTDGSVDKAVAFLAPLCS
ncbi:alpha/beta-hydrolase [Schizophyllum commune Tattone D]|nr:alpha/beta-hydrolase [Schizophyllum commune Tattone D]